VRRRTRRQALGVVAALAAAVIYWHPHLGDVGGPSASADNSPVASSLPGLLAQVRVVDDIGHVPGYERSCKKGQGCVFGPAWNDPRNTTGCDTRNRILATSLKDVQFKPGTHNCKVIAGHLSPDPYTGATVDLHQVAIDHIVPLKVSWDAGASKWDLERRREFANDTSSELLAVSSSANSSKGDSTPSEWLPRVGQCPYVIRYLAAAVKWQLPVTVKDRAAAIRACQ
jgi:hypothetical protein